MPLYSTSVAMISAPTDHKPGDVQIVNGVTLAKTEADAKANAEAEARRTHPTSTIKGMSILEIHGHMLFAALGEKLQQAEEILKATQKITT
jgi:hypothetical protein